MDNFLRQPLPIADWVEGFTNWLTQTFGGFFSVLQNFGQFIMDGMTNFLLFIPPLLWILFLTAAAFFISKKKLGLPLFTFLGLLFIYNQGLWTDLLNTVTLVIISSVVSIMIGIPLGIWMAKSARVQQVITPILDLMQTMPGFVYLIPAVAFFGIGMVPGVFASVIFALPPTVRFTNLGIRQISTELVEASDSFGGTSWQKLVKLELPLAKSTILAGINQTMMLALSMVVIASMIGAPGLGRGVLSALQRAQVGNGFVSGISLVILAIIMDRMTQKLNRPSQNKQSTSISIAKKKWWLAGGAAAIVFAMIGAVTFGGSAETKETVKLAYVEWDSEVASTHVVAQVLKEMGYDVETTPLDNAIMWESVAKGEVDGMVGAWLPSTHQAQFTEYKDQVEDLGANLTGAKLGIAVPSYMPVNSLADLKDEANKVITGIEPGAGVVAAAEKTIKSYANLADWQVATSSSGAMTAALGQAIQKQQPIVITGWSPHWMFAKYDLKYLEDPEGSMGKEESIHTVVRKNLAKDLPEAHQVLENFHWEKEDMEEVMLSINEGNSPQEAAEKWVEKNQKTVDSWKTKNSKQ